MAGKLKQITNSLIEKLTDEEERTHLQFCCVFIVFSIISLVMSVLNLFTASIFLTSCTLIFSFCNIINLIISLSKYSVLEKFTTTLFAVEVMSLFTMLIITGEPQGFSVLWTLLLPIAGPLLYHRKKGVIISGIMFAIIVFFFWLPFGRNLLVNREYYTETFMLRFPFVYLSSLFLGVFFETVRSFTHLELIKARDKYRKLSFTDQLTGLGNETAYFRAVTKMERDIQKDKANFAIAVMDVNNLKVTNDAYGHRYGCHLIVLTGRILPSVFPTSQIFHVGGDEFVVIFSKEDLKNIEQCSKSFEEKLYHRIIEFSGKKLVLSVAIGCALYKRGDSYMDVFQRADNAMYKNKSQLKEKYHLKR